jgi:hypothetical protein
MRIIAANMVLLDWFARLSDVAKQIFCEIVMKNGSLLTNMMLPPSATSRYWLISTGGMLAMLLLTHSGV